MGSISARTKYDNAHCPHAHGFIHFGSGYVVVPSGRGCRCQNIKENRRTFMPKTGFPPRNAHGLPRSWQHRSMADMADDLYAAVADLQDGCALSAREKAQFVLAGFVKALRQGLFDSC